MVHVHDPRGRWSVVASRVARIIAAADQRGAPAIDLLAARGPVAGGASHAGRVVVIRGAGDHEIALLAAGAIEIGDVDPGDVLPLPAALKAAAPQILAIVVAHDASLSLLLEPSAVVFPTTPCGEELCPSRS